MTDVHITVRLWHLVGFLLALVALWRFESMVSSGTESRQRPRRRETHGHIASSAARFDAIAEVPPAVAAHTASSLEPPPPPPSLGAAAANVAMAAVSTESLIGELHSRRYDWEVLDRVGIKFSSVREEELMHYLKRDKDKFNKLLTASDLGLSAQSTTQLLRTLSRRQDLAAALRDTGLGAGADFQCSFDESPRDGGCQIKCSGRTCARAEQKCRELGHCVSIDVNRDKTWATLKSLQVYMPVPPPICEGYAFHANGSSPLAISAPPTLEFDDMPAAGGAPNEGWCYRDTTVPQPPAGRSGGKGPQCTLESCFDLERCRAHAADPTSAPLRLFIDTPPPRGAEMVRLPSCLRQCMSESLVENARTACLVVPTVNINCEWDVCDPATHQMLRSMPSWNTTGRNHVIWDYIDGPHIKYRTDDALFMKTSMRLVEYRPGFDIPFPLLPNGEAAHVTPDELLAAASRRKLLASFKGVCQGSSNRPRLQKLHNGHDLIMLCTNSGGTGAAAQWDYKTLMLTSVFSVAPAGNGLHSFRLAEAIFFGSIPVIVDDQIVLPFCQVLDWRRFSVRIHAEQIPQLPAILKAIPPAKIAEMQRRLAEVKNKYFLFPFNTAFALMRERIREALRKRDARARHRL